MRFYDQPHGFYAGVDLHARALHQCPCVTAPDLVVLIGPGTHRPCTLSGTQGITPEAALVPNRDRTKAAVAGATSSL
jgi:hypothetical protein